MPQPRVTGLFSPGSQPYQQWPWPLPFSSMSIILLFALVRLYKIANHQQSTQHMDSTCWFNRPCLALRQLRGSFIRIHLLRPVLLLRSRKPRRAQCHLANCRRTVPLCICSLHRTMEKANGEFNNSASYLKRLCISHVVH